MTTTASPTDQKPGRLEQRKARTRAAILDAAARLFQANGFEATSIQLIAESAQTGIGTVYGYFASKEEILREVLKAHSVVAVEHYRSALSPGTNAVDRVCGALAAFAAYLREHRTILIDGFHSGRHNRAGDEAPTAWLTQAFQAMIADGIARGDIRRLPVDSTVRMLLSGYTTAMLGIGGWHGREDDPQTMRDLEALTRALLTP